jgi:hypothetical protein
MVDIRLFSGRELVASLFAGADVQVWYLSGGSLWQDASFIWLTECANFQVWYLSADFQVWYLSVLREGAYGKQQPFWQAPISGLIFVWAQGRTL